MGPSLSHHPGPGTITSHLELCAASSLASLPPGCLPPFHSPHSSPNYLLKHASETSLLLCLESLMASHHTQKGLKSIPMSHRLFPIWTSLPMMRRSYRHLALPARGASHLLFPLSRMLFCCPGPCLAPICSSVSAQDVTSSRNPSHTASPE